MLAALIAYLLLCAATLAAAIKQGGLAGRFAPGFLTEDPPIHGTFGAIGWLTVLVMGGSTRTVRPIVGRRSRSCRSRCFWERRRWV